MIRKKIWCAIGRVEWKAKGLRPFKFKRMPNPYSILPTSLWSSKRKKAQGCVCWFSLTWYSWSKYTGFGRYGKCLVGTIEFFWRSPQGTLWSWNFIGCKGDPKTDLSLCRTCQSDAASRPNSVEWEGYPSRTSGHNKYWWWSYSLAWKKTRWNLAPNRQGIFSSCKSPGGSLPREI